MEVKRLRSLAFGTSSTVSSPTDTDSTEAEAQTVIVGGQPLDSADNDSLSRTALDHEDRCFVSEKIESKATDREFENKGTIVLMRTPQKPLPKRTEPNKVEGIPWLQEAMDTVNMLETRLQELEHVCQSIPLYEQDNIAMFKVLQEMDKAHLDDQRWIEHTEDAIRWATFVLEEALLKSSSSFNDERSQVLGNWSGQSENYAIDSNWRKSRSEGALLTLTVPDVSQGDNESMSTSNDVNKPTTQARVSLALRTRRQLSCTAGQTRVGNESDVSEVDKQGSRRRLQQNWGLVVNTRRSAELEATHKDAISAALRHLKSIEHAPAASENLNCNYGDSWENVGAQDLQAIPCRGAKEGHDINAPREPVLADEIAGTRDDTTTLSTPPPPVVSKQSDLSLESRSLPAKTRNNLLPVSGSLSTLTTAKPLNPLSVSKTSIQATLSASSQSLQTDLGDCLLDERVYLKQHIQALDQLRFQDQVRYQKLEQGHRQLISDLERFSKELLGSANELTCAQASLVEACELTSLTLKTIDSPDSTTASDAGVEGPAEDTRVATTRQKRLAVACNKELTETKGMIEQGIKKIRRLAADCVGIAELAQTHATAQEQEQEEGVDDPASTSPTTCTSPAPANAVPATFCSKAYLLSTIPPPSPATPYAPAAPVHKLPNSMFVDGIGFQEFEGHLASLRTTFGAAPKRSMTTSTTRSTTIHSSASSSPVVTNIMTTPFMKRALAEDIYPCLLINPKSSPSKPSSGWMSSLLSSSSLPGSSLLPPSFPMSYGSSPQTAWLQRLLNAMERNACEIELWKPAPSRGTSLSSVSSKQPHSRGQVSTGTTTTTTTTTTTSPRNLKTGTGGPSKAPCCLCGIVRLCEFRLRILEQEDGPPSLSSGNKKKAHSRSSLYVDSTPVSQHPACAAPYPSAYRRVNETLPEYHPLDRFCRDRIVAVCDFYMFLAHLRQGLLDHLSSLELFRRAVTLRQRMACARIGSMDIVQGQAQQANVNTPAPLSLALATRE
ncbi:hypothetical protein EC968_005688 [Mortierella alpina]|nr:hypothetical protein EC968_005688 [Mortierella alpina]